MAESARCTGYPLASHPASSSTVADRPITMNATLDPARGAALATPAASPAIAVAAGQAGAASGATGSAVAAGTAGVAGVTASGFPPLGAGWTLARVVALRDLSPTVREFRLQPEGGTRPWTVGSHLRVQVRHADGRGDERRYSLVGLPPAATAPAESGAHYRIAVKQADPSRGGSAFMWRLQVGDTLPLQHPSNHFELPMRAPQTLLIAGGIGITPILGMALRLAERRADVRLCYAARSEAELVFVEELRVALGDRLACFVDARGERLDVAAEVAALHPQGQALVCGPVPLLHAVRSVWAASGRLPQRLRFETFGNSGAHPTQAFTVDVPRHGLRLNVPADRSLLEVMEEAGLAVLADCRRGECGLCALDITGCDSVIDHRDVFLSAVEQQRSERLCACVSRACGGTLTVDTAYRPDSPPATAP
jgi:ferredoxin-NADP reductase